MPKRVLTALAEHAEDLALAAGTAAATFGAGTTFGPGYGFMVFGALAVAYGVWITERRP